MKICIIGLGSIGCRHIININKILMEREIEFKIDALRSNIRELDKNIKEIIRKEYYTIDELPSDYDIIFITNPTHLHYDTLKEVENKTNHVFLEKPAFDNCEYDLNKINIKTSNIYVACPLRYTPVIRYIKNLVNKEKIYSVRAISSSFLPDWRKNVDYRNVYSSKKAFGGGVSLDLIHEWDYLIYLFGLPNEVINWTGKYSELEIDSNDISIYMAKYQDKLVELHLDYFGRNTVRKLELYCENYVIEADIVEQSITFKGKEENKIIFEKEDFYINEMKYYFDIILEKKANNNDLINAIQTLTVALQDNK